MPTAPGPSPGAAELIRRATAALVADTDALFEAVDAAVLASQPPRILADPELREAIRESNRSNLVHWASAQLAHPGAPVAPNLAPETVGLARLIARRGIEDTSRVAYGAGQNLAWRLWMGTVFDLGENPAELREALELSAASIFGFVEAMLARLEAEVERERGELLSSENTRRLDAVRRVLAGAPAGPLGDELRHPIELFHQTAVVLSAPNRPEWLLARVTAVGEALGARLRRRPLSVLAGADTVWAWFASDGPIDDALVRELASLAGDATPDHQAVVATTGRGLAGFRQGHREALAAAAVAGPGVFAAAELALATLVAGEPRRIAAFVEARIGALDGDQRAMLRAHLAHRASPSATARATFTHRNTVLERIRRIEATLGAPIGGRELELGLALELDRFPRLRGPVPGELAWLPGAGGPRRPS